MHAHVQRLVSTVKMVTMLEGCTTEEQCSVVHFLWAKGFNEDINKEMFPVYGGQCLMCKAVHSWVTNILLMTMRLKQRCGSGSDNSQQT
jgi:hypothetical protein